MVTPPPPIIPDRTVPLFFTFCEGATKSDFDSIPSLESSVSSTKSEKQVRQAISDAEEGDGLPLPALREELAQRDARLQARALVAVRVGLYRP